MSSRECPKDASAQVIVWRFNDITSPAESVDTDSSGKVKERVASDLKDDIGDYAITSLRMHPMGKFVLVHGRDNKVLPRRGAGYLDCYLSGECTFGACMFGLLEVRGPCGILIVTALCGTLNVRALWCHHSACSCELLRLQSRTMW